MRSELNDINRLNLMMESITSIEQYMNDIDSLEKFSSNPMLCHAIMYNIQCIGESAYMLSKEFVAKHPEVPWAKIEGQRHVLVHDYYSVSLNLIWNVIQKDLPVLKSQIENILNE